MFILASIMIVRGLLKMRNGYGTASMFRGFAIAVTAMLIPQMENLIFTLLSLSKQDSSALENQPSPQLSDFNLSDNFWMIAGGVVGTIVFGVLAYIVISWWNSGKDVRAAKAMEAHEKKRAMEEEAKRQERIRMERAETWQRILTTGDETVEKWTAMSTDLSYILKYPMVANLDEPKVQQVVELITQYRIARTEAVPDDEDLLTSTLGSLTSKMKTAVWSLKTAAEQVREKMYTPAERKKLIQAQRLFNLAMDTAATPNERGLAYKALRDIMDNLRIIVSEEMEQNLAIEMKEVKAIEAGPVDVIKTTVIPVHEYVSY